MSKLKKYKSREENKSDAYFKCYNLCKLNLKRLKSENDCIFISGIRIRDEKDCQKYCKRFTIGIAK